MKRTKRRSIEQIQQEALEERKRQEELAESRKWLEWYNGLSMKQCVEIADFVLKHAPGYAGLVMDGYPLYEAYRVAKQYEKETEELLSRPKPVLTKEDQEGRRAMAFLMGVEIND